jgi:thymidylate synthase, flavin-dependent
MRRVTPKVFLVGQTQIESDGMEGYLKHVGVPDWLTEQCEKDPERSDCETLSEFMGRLCYRSWKPGMNVNVTKIREGNDVYLDNVLKVKHGSVIEHAVTNWVFADVSRVFTHELVRHRAGCAYSQESLRFVRLTDLGLWLPPEAEADPELKGLFEEAFKNLESLQMNLGKLLGIDDEGKQFKEKKVLTSLMRRVAPLGLATTIGASFNFRTLRHILQMRTDAGAEVEIRLVMDQVASIAKERWPNIMGDFERQPDGTWKPKYEKV